MEQPLPCDTTMSGSLSPLIGQSFAPDRVIGPKRIFPDGSEQGYHIAPVRAEPPASAATSMNRKPAACASVAVREGDRNEEPGRLHQRVPRYALRHLLRIVLLLQR